MTPVAKDRGVLILAGGRGERFWPWSTPERPKQLLPLASGGRSLLRATYERARQLVDGPERIVVMTSQDLRGASLRECPGARVLGEPMMRNTAPAIAAAAGFAFTDDTVFAVLPSDHAIDDEAAFVADMRRAFEVAGREAVLVTFGIPPTAPEPSLGYIHRGAKLSERLYRVAQFTEKPDRERAAAWIATGEYAWNSGMFVWKRRTFFDALEAQQPAIAQLRGFGLGGGDDHFAEALRPHFEPLQSISVDYAVLEGAPNVLTLEAAFDWDDLGSWSAWARRQPKDARGNVLRGDAVPVDCDDCVIVGEGGTAAALGLRGMVVVHVNGRTLCCPLAKSEQVRSVSEAVAARAKP